MIYLYNSPYRYIAFYFLCPVKHALAVKFLPIANVVGHIRLPITPLSAFVEGLYLQQVFSSSVSRHGWHKRFSICQIWHPHETSRDSFLSEGISSMSLCLFDLSWPLFIRYEIDNFCSWLVIAFCFHRESHRDSFSCCYFMVVLFACVLFVASSKLELSIYQAWL
jgi:hypothetical protein